MWLERGAMEVELGLWKECSAFLYFVEKKIKRKMIRHRRLYFILSLQTPAEQQSLKKHITNTLISDSIMPERELYTTAKFTYQCDAPDSHTNQVLRTAVFTWLHS